MRAKVTRKTEEELLSDYPIRSRVPGWFLREEEISAGAWKVEGTDAWGRKVSATGSDPEVLHREIETKVKKM